MEGTKWQQVTFSSWMTCASCWGSRCASGGATQSREPTEVAEELPDGDVEGVGGFLEYQVVFGQFIFILHPLESVDDSGVLDLEPLGLPVDPEV